MSDEKDSFWSMKSTIDHALREVVFRTDTSAEKN